MTPRTTRAYAVLGFGSTHDALAAEATLKEGGLAVAAIPAPLALGSLCGIAIRIEPADLPTAEGLLAAAGLAPTGQAEIEDY